MNVSPFLNWLLRTSWQASILVVLVLAVQRLFRRRLNARWQYALWLLVVLRLAMPSLPASSWSVFNVVHYAAATAALPRAASEVARPTVSLPVSAPITEAKSRPENVERARIAPPPAVAPVMFDKKRLGRDAAIAWLAGLLLLGGRAIGQNIIFVRRLRTAKAVKDAETLALFARCKEVMGVSKTVLLAETDHVKSPALYGFFRPALLLPRQVRSQFSPAEQRHIFLHELAHVKRRDMAVHWVATVLRLLHWFNPVLWFGFQRMAADRELACDELALACAGENETRPYGETVLKLLEICARPAVWPGLMGILEEKSQMTRRILMIARYKQQSHWPILALLLLLGLGLVTLTDAQTEKPKPGPAAAAKTARPDLIGEVHLSNGQPVMATVFIDTAGPKIGTSPFCPSCYADCIKSTKADAQGRFKIESLDPTLIFRILVVAKDCAPQYVGKVDPAKGPVKVILEARNYGEAPPDNTLRGRVVDGHGAPIIGAAVESQSVQYKDGTGYGGLIPGVDPLAVTDERGEFWITSQKPFATMDVKVEARGFARKRFTELSSGTTPHDLTMTEGAVVLGRVTWNGKPLPGVSVGIVSTDRSMEHFTGNFEVGTDTYGRFAFVNLPPHVQYNLYGIMQSFLNYGAVMSSQVSTEGDGSRVDAGELVVGPAHRLAGRVVLDDGKPIPPETRLLVGREDAWDTLQIVLDQDGHFDTAGVPSGAVSLSVQVPGYRVSAKNASLDTLNPFGLSGRVDQDITNLVLLMEKGPNLEPNYESPAMNARQGQPLRGAENANDHSNQIAISGHVVDAETKRPIARFRVTPGHARRFAGEPDRLSQRTVDGANGAFTVYIDGTTFDPLLKAEADGYLPAASPTLMPNRTNYDFALTRGTGPRGTVLLPNGQPAEGVSVLLVCAGEDYTDYYTGLDEDGRLTGYQNQSLKMQTDASGRFSFAPELQMESVIFSGPRGLTWVSVESLAGGPGTVVLNPWGKIKGKLQRTSGPSKGEDLETKAVPPPGVPEHAFSLGGQAVTDADGNFEFDRVPAGVSKLSCRVKTRRQPMAGSQNVTLQQVTVKPGETLELTIHAPDRLPEVSQRLKQYAPQAEKPAKSGPLLRAVVLLPDGTPVAGADVACVSSNVILIIQEHSLQGGLRAARIIQTAKDGSFTLDTDDATTDIVAVHQKGFAKVSPEKVRASGKIDLQPWGRIEGVLHIGSRLGTNEVVGLTRTGFGARYITLAGEGLNFRARTDSQGRFLIRDVPPIEQSIGRLVSPGQGFTSVTNILVKAGEPTWVEIGGTGRPVLGQLVLDEAGKQVDWTTAGCTLRSKLPPFPKFKTMQEQGAWWTSESGPKWRFYSMLAKADGSFRIEDVPPGPYDLMITIRQETPGRRTSRAMKTIASGQKEVTVAESQGPADDSPVDLGTIPVKVHHPLGIGDMAAPIDAQTLDGLPLRLADYRGTNVLLIFGVPPSNSGEIDQLKEIASACAGDKRLAMINISLHWDPDLAKDAFKRSDLNCIRGFVSTEKSNRDIFEKYADTSPIINNFICLIDPDGKIIGKDMIGAEIEDSVAKALAKK